MKRIGALNGMGWLVLSLIFQASYTAVVAAQEVNEAPSPIQLTFPANVSLDYWTGRIEQDTTWRDTVYVGGDVTIASGATLTLAPDTKVRFLPYHDDTQGGLDSTRAELIVEGRLNARAGGIVFGSANAASLGRAEWYGIIIKRGGLADISNAMIRDGLCCLCAERSGLLTMGRLAAVRRLDHIALVNCGTSIEREEKADTRLGKKLAAGALWGVGGGLAGGAIMVSAEDGDFGNEIPALLGFWAGNLVGTAVGVSSVDPQDNFLITLAGSALLGAVVPYGVVFMFADVNNKTASGIFGAISVLSAFLGPIVGATISSERWRKPLSAKLHLKPEARRVSVGLVPQPQRGLSAIATLRF